MCPTTPTYQPSRKSLPVTDTPNLDAAQFNQINRDALLAQARADHKPRILLLYGSLRETSYSRLASEEAARILFALGAETRMFDPAGLPLPDAAPASHEKVEELRELVMWSEGMVWCSPERHGAMTGIMQACGGSQSFNAVNQLRILGRWIRLLTIPNQSSVPKAFLEFDSEGRMKPSPLYNRIVDVMEELMKFTLLTRGANDYLLDRYSERVETAAELSARVNQKEL